MGTLTYQQAEQAGPGQEQAVENVAIVRAWWTVLEREWRAVLGEREDEPSGSAILERAVKDALAPFEDFDAAIGDFHARGDQVVVSITMRGRIGNRRVELNEAWSCRLAEGAVVEVRDYVSLEDALAAVAL